MFFVLHILPRQSEDARGVESNWVGSVSIEHRLREVITITQSESYIDTRLC
jgi:hypothetical protein